MKNVKEIVKCCLLAVMMTLLVACGGKLTQANFEKVKQDMTTDEVKGILGAPTETNTTSLPLFGTVTTFTYKTEKSEATVIFHEGKVKTKIGTINE